MKRKKNPKKIAAAFRTRDHLTTKPPPSPLGYLTILHITVIKLLLIRLTELAPCRRGVTLLLNASRQTPTRSCRLPVRNCECSLIKDESVFLTFTQKKGWVRISFLWLGVFRWFHLVFMTRKLSYFSSCSWLKKSVFSSYSWLENRLISACILG